MDCKFVEVKEMKISYKLNYQVCYKVFVELHYASIGLLHFKLPSNSIIDQNIYLKLFNVAHAWKHLNMYLVDNPHIEIR